jgi:hypothetical protein
MFNILREVWKLNWDFFFRKSKHTVQCFQCKKPITVTARPPRLNDYGPVGSVTCRCGWVTEVSRYTHTIIGFGRPMPEEVRVKHDSKVQ